MSNFADVQGRTKVFTEAYLLYVADKKPAENPPKLSGGLIGKRAIYERKLAAAITACPKLIPPSLVGTSL
jgi:hypothetical protein